MSDLKAPGLAKTKGTKYDSDKLRYDLVDELAQRELVAVLSFGAIKYDAGNWKLVEDAIDRYYAAAKRHLAERRLGGTRDKESGLLTLGHALCCIHFLLALDAGEEEATEDFEARFAGAMKVAHDFREQRERLKKSIEVETK